MPTSQPTGTQTPTETPTYAPTDTPPPLPTSTSTPLPPTVTPCPTPLPTDTPTATPEVTEEDIDAIARMLYAEQRSEPDTVRIAAAWVVRNRVDTSYRGLTTYREQIDTGEFASISETDVENLSESNRQIYDELRRIAEGVIDTSLSNPMVDAPDAIFFANSSYSDPGQQTAYEELLDDDDGCVGSAQWGFFEGNLGRFYYYENNSDTDYPCSIPFPPRSTPTPIGTPGP